MLERWRDEFISLLGGGLIGFLARSIRWQRAGNAVDKDFFKKLENPVIVAFWHDQQLMMPRLYFMTGGKIRPVYALISQHRDGRRIARAMEHLGIRSVAGSSTRGGSGALKALVKKLKEGSNVAITPDGPKGPRHEAKAGIVQLAKLSGATIVPMAFATERYKAVNSWDRMRIPLPFSRGVIALGTPLTIPRDSTESDLPHWLAEVERSLTEVAEIAEHHVYV